MMNACQFEPSGIDDGQHVYTCRVCQRSIKIASPSAKIHRNCIGQVPHEPDEPVLYCAFWPREQTTLYGVTIRPWLFVHVPQSWLAGLPYSYELIENDASYVGTRLKELFAKLGYSQQEGGCNCAKLAAMLDSVSLEFIQRHRASAVDQIVQSAAQQSVTAPHAIIDKLLGYVLWKERRRLDRQNAQLKHPESSSTHG